MDEKMNLIVVYIDDDIKMKEDAFLDDIEDEVDEIVYFEKPSEGLDYIKNNIDKNIVTILDWKFSNSSLQGENVLNDIYAISALVPVSGSGETYVDQKRDNLKLCGK